MGAFLDKPKTEKYNESRVGGGLRYGLSSMQVRTKRKGFLKNNLWICLQGWRIEMEDAHSAIIGIPDQKDTVCWFAVFDGHAGSRVSAHCSHHLLDCIRLDQQQLRLLSLKYFPGLQMTSPAVYSRNTRFHKMR